MVVDISQYNTTGTRSSQCFTRDHKAQLTFPFDCMAAVKSIKSARRAAETSGPASMTAAVIRSIDGLHAHNDRAALVVQYISGRTCLRSMHI